MEITQDTNTALLVASRFAAANQAAENAVNALNVLFHAMYPGMGLKTEEIGAMLDKVREVGYATGYNAMREYIKNLES